jgi:NADPH:quinone reductase-like Zn-dependent oxidoreductase
MRVVELRGFGLDQLHLAERAEPQPGPGDVLVRVRAVSLNYRDLLICTGSYDPKLHLPRVPISDGAGEVLAVGPGVSRFAPGDRVAANFFPNWQAGPISSERIRPALGGDCDGMLAELVVLPERAWLPLPATLSFEEGATLPCAALTAWNALFAGPSVLTAGQTVLVQGTGGVSIFALQLAKLAGARVIVTSSSDEKLNRAVGLGADDTINYRTTPEWDKRVRELTDGRGVDHVVEVGGAGTLNRSLRAVRTGGTISLIGVLTGAAGSVDTVLVLMRAVTVRGIFVGSCELFAAMNRAIEQARLKPVIDRVFDFEQAAEALRYLQSATHFGKIVVRVGS